MKKLFLAAFLATVLNMIASPLTNVVPFTPCLTFYVQKDVGGPANVFKADEMIFRTLLVNGTNIEGNGLWAGTNIVSFRYLPSYAQFYDFKLFNDKGREISKTKKGLDYSRAATPPRNDFELYEKFTFHPIKVGDTRAMLRPDDMFIITNAGVYQMEVQMRICVPMTNGVADTNLMENASKCAAASNFGIIESPPIRIEVVKE